jgi:putative intracellular protease/amidase
MQIAIPIFERFTALDAIGPYDVLSRLPGARVTFVAKEAGEYRSDNGMLGLIADASYADVPNPDVLVFPGGFGTRPLLDDADTLDWVRGVHATSRWTTSVCTGSLVLAAAGVLEGREATTHWAAGSELERLGSAYVEQRVVQHGKVITAAGVSAGIDMALSLAAQIAGDDVAQAIQLYIEYDPQPPFDSGAPSKAPASVMALVGQVAAAEAANSAN